MQKKKSSDVKVTSKEVDKKLVEKNKKNLIQCMQLMRLKNMKLN